MTLAIGIAFLFNWINFSNAKIARYNKLIGWALISLGLPEYLLSIINLIERF